MKLPQSQRRVPLCSLAAPRCALRGFEHPLTSPFAGKVSQDKGFLHSRFTEISVARGRRAACRRTRVPTGAGRRLSPSAPWEPLRTQEAQGGEPFWGTLQGPPAPLPAPAPPPPAWPAESAPTQHRRTSWSACCRVAGTGSCWLSRTGPGSPHGGQEPSGHSVAILTQPHWDGENGTCRCPWAPGQQNCWHRKAVPSPALQREARLGTFNPTQRPKAPRQQLPAVPAPANRPSSSQPAQQALPSSQPGKAAHTPPGKRQPPACEFPPPCLHCRARGGWGRL